MTDNRTVIVDRGGGGGSGATIVAILVILVLVVAGWYFLAGPGAGAPPAEQTDINVNLPSIQAPQAS